MKSDKILLKEPVFVKTLAFYLIFVSLSRKVEGSGPVKP